MTIDVTKVSTDVLAAYLRSGAGSDPYEAEAARRLEALEKDQAELLAALKDLLDPPLRNHEEQQRVHYEVLELILRVRGGGGG